MAIDSEKLQEMAVIVIHNYYDGYYSKEHIKENFNLAVELLVENAKNKISGATSISENGVAITYNSADKFAITSDIKALLPKKRNFGAW